MKITLINMPMATLETPSLGLTLLKGVLEQRFKGRISCRIRYLNHDLARHIGRDLYRFIAGELNSGLGEWLFRSIAFPDAPDNTHRYFQQYFVREKVQADQIKAAILELRSHLDAILDRMISNHSLFEADITGFTSLFYQNVASLALARKLKQINNRMTIVMGGANVEYPMGLEVVNHVAPVDFVFSGPALASFPDFVENRLKGEPDRCHDIPGIFSRQNADRYSSDTDSHGRYGKKIDIDRIPAPDYDDFLVSYETIPGSNGSKPYIFFLTSEGCFRGEQSRCTFCAQAGPCGNSMSFSSMTPQKAVDQIESLYRYQGRVAFLYAADSILPPHYPKAVFAKIDSGIPLHLEMSVHKCHAETIRILSQAGVRITEAGIESLSTQSLRLMRKGTTAAQNLQFLMDCLANDIFVTWNFLLGVPGETADTYERFYQVIPTLVHFPPPEIAAVTFERFSAYHENPEAYGLDLKPYPFYPLTYPFGESTASVLATNFYDAGKGSYKQALSGWIQRLTQRCEEWKSLWNRQTESFPCLYRYDEAGETIIVDTRSGSAESYPISPVQSDILDVLRKPHSIKDLIRIFPGVAVNREMENLRTKGLLFKDEACYFNIVFDEKPDIPSIF